MIEFIGAAFREDGTILTAEVINDTYQVKVQKDENQLRYKEARHYGFKSFLQSFNEITHSKYRDLLDEVCFFMNVDIGTSD